MGKINMATSTINTLLTLVQNSFSSNKLKIENGGTGVDNLNALRSILGLGPRTDQPIPISCGGTGATSLEGLKGQILSGGTGAMGVAAGGTGRADLGSNSVIIGDGANQVKLVSANGNVGVFQVNTANATPIFDKVPIALGGTGATTISQFSNTLGLGGATIENNTTTFDAIPVARGGTGRKTLNDVSNDLGLGATVATAIPISRGGTGATNLLDVKSQLGYVSNAGDTSLNGDYVINGNIQIENTRSSPTVSRYNLTTRLATMESTLNTLNSTVQSLEHRITQLENKG